METTRRGGCQCGAVRYEITGKLGRASICHCRMCQKALGNAFAPFVTARGLGFCPECGTPLSYEPDGFHPEVAIATLDDPRDVAPVLQVGIESKLPWCDSLHALPTRSPDEAAKVAAFFNDIVSNQHPDHDPPDR
jgi:hypothetical protein